MYLQTNEPSGSYYSAALSNNPSGAFLHDPSRAAISAQELRRRRESTASGASAPQWLPNGSLAPPRPGTAPHATGAPTWQRAERSTSAAAGPPYPPPPRNPRAVVRRTDSASSAPVGSVFVGDRVGRGRLSHDVPSSYAWSDVQGPHGGTEAASR